MKRELFEKEAGVRGGEIMPCVSPIGYPAKKRSIKEIGMRTAIRADKRIKNEEAVLENGLEGYSEYKQKVKYRLIPFIW